MDTRSELAQLLAKVVYRLLQPKILTPQNVDDSGQDCLAVSPETLLTVTTTVNANGEQGEDS